MSTWFAVYVLLVSLPPIVLAWKQYLDRLEFRSRLRFLEDANRFKEDQISKLRHDVRTHVHSFNGKSQFDPR